MKLFLQSLLLATTVSLARLATSEAIEINGLNYCAVTVASDLNSQQYVILVPKANVNAVAQKLEVVEIDCDSKQATQPLF